MLLAPVLGFAFVDAAAPKDGVVTGRTLTFTWDESWNAVGYEPLEGVTIDVDRLRIKDGKPSDLMKLQSKAEGEYKVVAAAGAPLTIHYSFREAKTEELRRRYVPQVQSIAMDGSMQVIHPVLLDIESYQHLVRKGQLPELAPYLRGLAEQASDESELSDFLTGWARDEAR